MAARGRGGKSTSLTYEHLQTMGCVGKDAMPQVQTVPPPTYPILLNKPTKTEETKEDQQDMEWKEDYFRYLHESPYFKALNKDEIIVVTLGAWEKWAELILGPKKVLPEEYDWKRTPKELQLVNRKRKAKLKKDFKAYKTLIPNPDEKLKALEEREKLENQIEKPTKSDADESEDDDNAFKEFVADEEMDDENDYGANYFDNGEAYNEEDDNQDDGPVY